MAILRRPSKRVLAAFHPLAFLILSSTLAQAAPSDQGFSYQGRFMNEDGTAPLTGSIEVTFAIYEPDPSGTCLLYEETQSGIDLDASDGYVTLRVGSPRGATQRSPRDPDKSMAQVFANGGEIRAAGSPQCTDGYTPQPNDSRRLRVTVTPHAGAPVTLSPDLVIATAPLATVAETLQGLAPASFLRTSTNATQLNIEALVGGANASSLHKHDDLYAKLGELGGANLNLTGVGPGVGDGKSLRWDATEQEWEAYTPAAASGITEVTGTSPIVVANGTTTPSISVGQASGVAAGILSAADYLSFSNKLSSSLASGNILVGNGSGSAAAVALSGDATLSNTGALTLKDTGTPGTYTKVTTDAQGRVSGGAALALGDLPRGTAGDVGFPLLSQGAGADSSYSALNLSSTAVTGVPDCDDATGNHLNYDSATHTFSCGTSSSAASSQWEAATGGINYAGGNVGIGTSSPTSPLSIRRTVTLTSGTTGASDLELTLAPTANASASATGLKVWTGTNAANSYNYGQIVALDATASYDNTGSVPNITGVSAVAKSQWNGSVASMKGAYLQTFSDGNAGSHSVGSAMGLHIDQHHYNLGGSGATYGIYIDSYAFGAAKYGVYIADGSGPANSYGIYQAKLAEKNYFAGNVGIGTTNPAQKLSVAGVVESTSGGFKFPDGTTQATAATGVDLSAPGAIGATTPSSAVFTTVSSSSGITSTSGVKALAATAAPTAIATSALVELGSGGFAGGGGGNFSGSASGTVLGTNMATGFAGNFADFQINGTSKFSVSGAGNAYFAGKVGIGTNSPAGPFVVNTAAGFTDQILELQHDATPVFSVDAYGVVAANKLATENEIVAPVLQGGYSASADLTIDSTGHAAKGRVLIAPNGGNVGIGTEAPSSKLTLLTNSIDGSPSAYFIDTNDGGVSDLLTLHKQSATGSAGLHFTQGPGSGNDIGRIMGGSATALNITSYGRSIALNPNNSTAMTLSADGNVGIGTATPDQKLSVAGVIESTSGGFKFPDGTTQGTAATTVNLAAPGAIGATTPSSAVFTTVSSSSGITSTSGVKALAATAAPTAIATSALVELGSGGFAGGGGGNFSGSASGTVLGSNMATGFAGNFADFQVNGTSKFSVSGAGNAYFAGKVGIGASPDTEQLTVSGGIAVSKSSSVSVTSKTASIVAESTGTNSGEHIAVSGYAEQATGTAQSGSKLTGGDFSSYLDAANGTSQVTALNAWAGNYAAGTLTGARIALEKGGDGTVSTVTGADISAIVGDGSGGTVTDNYGIKVDLKSYAPGTLSNRYGLHLQASGDLAPTNDFGIYQATATQKNYFAGNVGIGTSSPGAKLDVAGSIRSSGQISSGQQIVDSGAAVDFDTGNTQILNAPGGTAITLTNMKDGGAYTVIITDTTSRTYTFTNCTNSHFSPANGPTVAATQSIYSIIKTTQGGATHCYISWITGFN